MLRLFRKIRQKFLNESRMRKYLIYAVGEILLIIVGILIALQINNLNDDSKEERILISDLKNAQEYIRGEIESEDTERQNLHAWIDTIQQSLRIIEEVDELSAEDSIYIFGALRHLRKVGLKTGEVNSLHHLSTSVSKSDRESRHELVSVISQLINEIQKGDYLDNSFYEDLLARDRLTDPAIWRSNSKGEMIYNFQLMKTNYEWQHYFRRSINYKKLAVSFSTTIIDKYTELNRQIEDMLDDLE